MRGAGTESGFFYFCSRIADKFCKISSGGRRTLEASLRRDRHIRRRLLQIEPLETRALMSADGLVAYVDPLWFADCCSDSTLTHAGATVLTAESSESASADLTDSQGQSNIYDWIIQFDTQAISNITSVSEVSSLLVGGDIDFQVMRGLGLVGQVLVRSTGVSPDSVTTWLENNVNIVEFEQDSLQYLDITSNDPAANQQYDLSSIDAQQAWNLTTGSSSVVVGVVDTGIDYTHSDLAANIWINPGEIVGNGIDDDGNGFIDDVYGYDFVNNDSNPMDDNGHGTHVSGTIAAVGNNSRGVSGVNWSASLMALKFLDSTGSGYISDAVRAINYATMMRNQYNVNLRVLNNSWGGGGYSSALAAAIAASNNAGILFVAAAGNSTANNDASAQYPANYTAASVISVAASDQNDQLASFSNYGAKTVDLAAPGVSIYSTLPNNRYGTYSGTSMATPHVAGVAALAWAYNPDATVAEVRNAILQGVDKISSLTGKVASGGRLNAYNTLQLLGGDTVSTPVLGSFSINPSTVAQGATVTLTAQKAASSCDISAVYFYQDSNGNGAFDSSDTSVGADTAIVNGTAELSLSTAGMTQGTYRYFARALNNDNIWSEPLSTTVAITAADDYGNSVATAALISVNSLIAGSIETAGDVDWFKFQAVAGKKYIISTKLKGLRDSVLTLYDSNGVKLAYNDDVAYNNLSSYIKWKAPASGTYYLKVSAYSRSMTGAYKLSLGVINSAPVLATIADQSMSYRTDALTITIPASDPDHDPLTYSATVYGIDSLGQDSQQVPLANGSVSLKLKGNRLTIDPADGFTGRFYVSVSVSDGLNVATSSFKVSVTNSAPVLGKIANQTMSTATDKITIPLAASDADGDRLSFSVTGTVVDPLAQKAYELDQQFGLRTFWGYYCLTNLRGAGEKYLTSRLGDTYFILPNGALYRWKGSIAASKLVYTFNSSYYDDPSLLYKAQPPGQSSLANSVALSVSGNQLIIDPANGYTGKITVTVTVTDGTSSVSKSFKVKVTAAASQSLNLSSLASVGAAGYSASGTILPQSTISHTSYMLDTNCRANLQNTACAALWHDTITSSLPENNFSDSSSGLPAGAVQSAFQDLRIQESSWWSDYTNRLKKLSGDAWDDAIGARKGQINFGIFDHCHASGADAANSPNLSGSASAVDLEAILKTWQDQASESEVRQECFALLGRGGHAALSY
jgi:subtilisin family serine protease